MKEVTFKELDDLDLSGKVWVMPTDTIPGFSCLVNDRHALERVVDIKQRSGKKSFIVLLASQDQLGDVGVNLTVSHNKLVEKLWPGSVTIVLDSVIDNNFLLQEGSIGVRIPDVSVLQSFLDSSGPVVSTSINISGGQPYTDYDTIKRDFGKLVDYVVTDNIPSGGQPSSIIKIVR